MTTGMMRREQRIPLLILFARPPRVGPPGVKHIALWVIWAGLFLCGVAWADMQDYQTRVNDRGNIHTSLPTGTIRQSPFPDLFGNPVYHYDNKVVRQRPFPDALGNPVYDVKEEK